jgi:D-2-hydroxyacid dehydrogenase (NADP+)
MNKIKIVVMGGPWLEWIPDFRTASDKLEIVGAPTREDLQKEIVDADGLIGRLPREAFRAASKLRWVQSIGVGFETMLYPEMIDSDVVITNTAGAYDSVIGEHAMAHILAHTRGIVGHEQNRKDRKWTREVPVMQIDGLTACVLGLGSIGRAICKRLHAFGLKVIAVDVQAETPPEGVDQVVRPDGMLDAVATADFVVVALPLVEATEGIVNAECFDRMKDTAYVINIARGPLINQADLIEALQSGKIAGAGLDVFETEPLPEDNPLWDMPNVSFTPHIASQCDEGNHNIKNIFTDNLRRFANEEPLNNIIDKEKGYLVIRNYLQGTD